MSKSKNKYYVVWQGRTPGVYDSWEACKQQIEGCKGALYKGFPDQASAEAAFAEGFTGFEKKDAAPQVDLSQAKEQPVSPAIAVDAACAGNPGKMEYQGVYVDFGTQPATTVNLFKSKVFENGTNNIGEFLAIVHGLSYLKKHRLNQIIYSDSVNAINWVRQKVCKSKLSEDASTAELWDYIHRAENWLRTNSYTTEIRKWDTDNWGEIPADFGRK